MQHQAPSPKMERVGVVVPITNFYPYSQTEPQRGSSCINNGMLKMVFGEYFAALASSPVSLGCQPATLSISGEGYTAIVYCEISDKP